MTDLICIGCPKGCLLHVDETKDYEVTGYSCNIGKEYGRRELTDPRRSISSVVSIKNATHPVCPVKTTAPVPKKLMGEAVEALKNITITSPVNIGDVVVKNVCNTGIDWVVTKQM